MKNHLSLSFDLCLADTASAGPRRFVQRANSGRPFSYLGETVVIDLFDLKLGERIPALLDHDPTRRAGVIDAHAVTDNGLELRGYFLANSAANEVIADADAGFPWQASVRTEAEAVDQIPKGKAIEVNGETYQGPMTVHRRVTVRESSFVALGADPQTASVALNHSRLNQLLLEETPVDEEEIRDEGDENAEVATDDVAVLKAQLEELRTMLETVEAKMAEMEERAKTAEAKLSAVVGETRKSELTALGILASEVDPIVALPEAAYAATLKVLKATKSQISDRLKADIYASASATNAAEIERSQKIALVVGVQ